MHMQGGLKHILHTVKTQINTVRREIYREQFEQKHPKEKQQWQIINGKDNGRQLTCESSGDVLRTSTRSSLVIAFSLCSET